MFQKGLYNNSLNKVSHLKCFMNYVNVKYLETSSHHKGAPNPEENIITEQTKSDSVGTKKAKQPKRPPFVKNLFLGKFDRDILTYPQVLSKDRYEMLHEMIDPIERFFQDEVDSAKIDKEAHIPAETLKGLKELGLYGLQIPEEYGGLGLNATEYARLGEAISSDGSIAVTLSAHQAIGLKGLLLHGTDAQKQKYLPRLATGEWTAAFCLTEASSGSDAASIQTSAVESEDGKGYILNGTKIYISNGGTADFMTVFARNLHPNEINYGITAFIVERNFGGVTSGKPEDKLGIRGSNTTTIHFDNTFVPKENILGELDGGFKIAMSILNSGRFSMGSACAGQLRNLMSSVAEHAVTRKQFDFTLSEFALIKEKVALMTMDVYAMEAMSYLTAGLIDLYEDQDCSLEAAIVKVFSSERTWEHTSQCIQVLGGMGYMKECPFERNLRDSRILLIFEGTNEILRMFIALSGLQHAGLELYELVKKLRNPLMHPKFTLKTLWKRMRTDKLNPKLDLDLHEYLHPSLIKPSEQLERSVKLLQHTGEHLLGVYGKEISHPNHQLDLKRLADAVIDVYAMTAVLGRASRSYCIGVRNSDHEMLVAKLFCARASARVEENIKTIYNSLYDHDKVISSIAKDFFENKGYVPLHPLTRTFF
ncbi:UNVERIFIED_CONTAM: hypothetical protein RMT77_012992 [Armadillidium vulgare]